MAHEIDATTGRNAIAYVGATPWHGLGQQLTADASIETWQQEAGLIWEAVLAPVAYVTDRPVGTSADHVYNTFGGKSVLYRNDSGDGLGVVSDSYRIVQPREVVEFFRDAAEQMNCTLETAGALKGGRVAWALARNGQDVNVGTQASPDVVKSYILLSTSFDGSRATEARRTTVRVVCNNTLTLAQRSGAAAVRVSHRSAFDPRAAKVALGFHGFEQFAEEAEALSRTRVEIQQSVDFFLQVYHGITAQQASLLSDKDRAPLDKTVQRLGDILYRAPGQNLPSAQGTAWGLINAVTNDVDFQKPARSQENRLHSAWFGAGAELKQRAYDAALRLTGTSDRGASALLTSGPISRAA